MWETWRNKKQKILREELEILIPLLPKYHSKEDLLEEIYVIFEDYSLYKQDLLRLKTAKNLKELKQQILKLYLRLIGYGQYSMAQELKNADNKKK